MEQAINTAPAEEEVSGLPGISADEIERLARLAYEHPAWRHKQPWSRNPWARQHWTACITSVLATSAPTPPDRVGEEVGREEEIAALILKEVPGASDWPNIVEDVARQIAGKLASAPSPEAGAGGDLGWQPAETAPTNVAVQVYCPRLDYYGNQGVYAGMLVDAGTGQRWMTFAWAMGRDMLGENRPTHWRPLPAAPEAPDEAALRTLQAAGEVR